MTLVFFFWSRRRAQRVLQRRCGSVVSPRPVVLDDGGVGGSPARRLSGVEFFRARRIVSYRIVSYHVVSCRLLVSRVSDGVERIGSIVAARAGGRAGAVAPFFVLRSWFVDLGSRFVGRGASGPCAGAVTANGQSRLSRLWARSKIFAEEFVTAVDADPDGTSATAGPLKWCDRSVWRVFNPAVSDPGVSASPPR
eukprot:30631-Pelagococcus_subviridis.AAC.3